MKYWLKYRQLPRLGAPFLMNWFDVIDDRKLHAGFKSLPHGGNKKEWWTMSYLNEIIKSMEEDISLMEKTGENMNGCSWGTEEGVLLTGKQAQIIVTALKSTIKEGE